VTLTTDGIHIGASAGETQATALTASSLYGRPILAPDTMLGEQAINGVTTQAESWQEKVFDFYLTQRTEKAYTLPLDSFGVLVALEKNIR